MIVLACHERSDADRTLGAGPILHDDGLAPFLAKRVSKNSELAEIGATRTITKAARPTSAPRRHALRQLVLPEAERSAVQVEPRHVCGNIVTVASHWS